MNKEKLKMIIEAALLAAGRPLSIDQLLDLFHEDEQQPSHKELRDALKQLGEDCESRGVELREVASGFRYQIRQDVSRWTARLWEERPTRYSRALLETLALIAYRQPITRAEIEEVRGVSVSTSIMKTMLEREWVRVLGHREVPGRPAMYGTTRQFLDYFCLKSLDNLPELADIIDLDNIGEQLDLEMPVSGRGTEPMSSPGESKVGIEQGTVPATLVTDTTVSRLPTANDRQDEEDEDPRLSLGNMAVGDNHTS